jgi:hypothetical protein
MGQFGNALLDRSMMQGHTVLEIYVGEDQQVNKRQFST